MPLSSHFGRQSSYVCSCDLESGAAQWAFYPTGAFLFDESATPGPHFFVSVCRFQDRTPPFTSPASRQDSPSPRQASRRDLSVVCRSQGHPSFGPLSSSVARLRFILFVPTPSLSCLLCLSPLPVVRSCCPSFVVRPRSPRRIGRAGGRRA